MHKTVYSIVLMEDVVAAIDKRAYSEGTSRSNMMNRILAQAVGMATPEQRMQEIFTAVSDTLDRQNALQPMHSASDAMLNLRSALQYKYNPSVRYAVELYPHAGAQFGEVRAGLRTQNPALLLTIGQFYKLWAKLEGACLQGAPRDYDISDGRYARRLQTPCVDGVPAGELGGAIASYLNLFDACLKCYFEHLDSAQTAVNAVGQLYQKSLDSLMAQL
ncbi:MAG: hypothetical protein RR951_05705 [Ruthenibacterium sp.]